MIQQIFNLYSKFLKLIQYNNKYLLLFLGIIIVLYNYGYITEGRIIIFSITIIWICVYKIICKKIQEKDFHYNETLLYILLWIDYLKLIIINALIFLSIKTYEFKNFYKNNEITNNLILIFENLTINPVKMLLYKFYNVLYIWKTTPIFEIFFKRIYGSVLGVLIFSNIIGYLWYLMNYSILNVYILLVIVNAIDEIVKSENMQAYRIIKYIEFIKYLNLNKDIFKIIEYRCDVSVFSLYIKKVLKKSKLDIQYNKIKKFAFIIHLYFKHNFDDVNIIQFKKNVKQYKLNQLKINTNFDTLLDYFTFDIATLLDNYLILLSQLVYIKIKIKKNKNFKGGFSNYELYKLDELYKFTLLVVKMLLYYLWDLENINKDKYNFSNLMIDDSWDILNLEYTWCLNVSCKEIKVFDILDNKEFNEQVYLYANILTIFDISNFSQRIVSIDFEHYKNIEYYADNCLNNLIILHNKFKQFYGNDIDIERANEMDLSIEQEILSELQNYKFNFIEEWKASKKVSVECANLQRLKILNEYVDSKLKVK